MQKPNLEGPSDRVRQDERPHWPVIDAWHSGIVMWTTNRLGFSSKDWLAGLAGLAAAAASIVGFIPGLYRDSHSLVVQSHGQDLATLIVCVPTLAVGHWFASKGSLRGRLVAMGALGYLLYTYVVFAFFAVLNPATVPYIHGARTAVDGDDASASAARCDCGSDLVARQR